MKVPTACPGVLDSAATKAFKEKRTSMAIGGSNGNDTELSCSNTMNSLCSSYSAGREDGHSQNTEEGGEEEGRGASRARACTKGTGGKDAAPERARRSDGRADKQCLKRPAEDEVTEEEKAAAQNPDDFAGKLSKRQAKKRKANTGVADRPAGGYKAREVKKVRFAKELEERHMGSPITTDSDIIISSGQTVVGGVAITDVRIGEGVLAEEGVTVWIGYMGKMSDGTLVDDSTGRGLFSFVLGRGEVIQGWEIGIKGMRVGGERELNIPPALCHGEEELLRRGMPADKNWLYNSTNPFLSYPPNCSC